MSPAEGRRFGLVLGSAFLALAAILWWRSLVPAALVAGVPGTLLILGAAVIPGKLGPVNRAWMGFALLLSRVTTPVFMSVVFFAVLTPVGLLKRAFSGNTILRRRSEVSYWVDRSPDGGGRSDLERQF